MCLGVEGEDEQELKEDPAAVDGEVLPVDGLEGDGVHVGREETGQLSEDLLDTDTHGTLGIGEQLDEVGCNMVSKSEFERKARNIL